MKEKIKNLEKALVNSELRSSAYETMIEITEKELEKGEKKWKNYYQKKEAVNEF